MPVCVIGGGLSEDTEIKKVKNVRMKIGLRREIAYWGRLNMNPDLLYSDTGNQIYIDL